MNLRPSGYEPDELPGCSTPRQIRDHAGCAEKQRSNNHGTVITKLVKNTCVWKTRRRPTLPCLKTKYHRRYRLSRPSSEWDRVGHLCHNHLVIQTHVFIRFDRGRRAINEPYRQRQNYEDIQNLSVCLQIAVRWHLPLRTADQAYRTISTN